MKLKHFNAGRVHCGIAGARLHEPQQSERRALLGSSDSRAWHQAEQCSALRLSRRAHCAGRRAFSLLEVMIAIAIFFVASFAILGLISSSLNNVRRLQRPSVDASPVLARYAATNILIEGDYNGSLGDDDMLGKDYRGYNWRASIVEVGSNRLFSVRCVITPSNGKQEIISDLATVLYKPQSPPGSLDGAMGMKGR